uniref:G-protein coupled receptors family 1 profile domain-containing protein n=1 Tax=Denticeps clupeoides TaxID=299321 RepID=A0AAY4CDS0_9TELE
MEREGHSFHADRRTDREGHSFHADRQTDGQTDNDTHFTQTEKHNIVAGYLITACGCRFVRAASDLHGSWKFGYAGCQIYAALNIFFGMASIGLLTVVAIDRYLTICRPDVGQKMTTHSYTAMIVGAWLNAVFWSSMPAVGWAGYAPDPTGATCTINWRNNDASFISYTMAVIAVNFVVPLSVMFYCYYNVSVTVRRYKATNSLDTINMDWSDQMDVTKMSVVMIVMFLVAWSPYSMVCLWASFSDPKTIPAPMAIIAPLFAKSSTFYNPCIYVAANKKFRRAILGMLRCQTQQQMTLNIHKHTTTTHVHTRPQQTYTHPHTP